MVILLEEQPQLLNLLCEEHSPSKSGMLTQAKQAQRSHWLTLTHTLEQHEHPAQQPRFLDILVQTGCPPILTALLNDIGWERNSEGSWPGSASLVPLELRKGVLAEQVLVTKKSSPLLTGTAL